MKGIKRVYKRLEKAQERFLEKSEDIGEACITRMNLKSKADGVAYCLSIIEQECPEVLEEQEVLEEDKMIVTLTSSEAYCFGLNNEMDSGKRITHPKNYEYAERLREAGYSVSIDVWERRWDAFPVVNVEVKSIKDVMNISKVLGCDVILQHRPVKNPQCDYECDIMVYDDYLE